MNINNRINKKHIKTYFVRLANQWGSLKHILAFQEGMALGILIASIGLIFIDMTHTNVKVKDI